MKKVFYTVLFVLFAALLWGQKVDTFNVRLCLEAKGQPHVEEVPAFLLRTKLKNRPGEIITFVLKADSLPALGINRTFLPVFTRVVYFHYDKEVYAEK